jgi:hypothetical protein
VLSDYSRNIRAGLYSLHKNLSFYFSMYFEGCPPAADLYGVMQWGGRSRYISMFPWWSHGKIFGQEGSRKFKNTRRKGTDQEFFFKTRKKWKKEKEEMCSPLVGTALLRPSPQENHSYGNLPYNILLLDL